MAANGLVDTLFVLVCALLVFFMNAGFALLESGLCRARNAASVLAKNFAVFGIAALAYWAVGYGLMFGAAEWALGGLVGRSGFFPDGSGSAPVAIPESAFFFFQLAFVATAASIVSGAVAERTKYVSYLVFCLACCGVIYPVVGHLAWGGGWLTRLGFLDYAGSTVVHATGGTAALVGAWLVGPRQGSYDAAGRPRALPGHSLALATLGSFVLWLGWFGFNAGSGLAFDENALRVILTTVLASSAGVLSSTAVAWWRLGKPELTMTLNGCLGALVSITAGCAVVTPGAAVVIGAGGGALAVLAVPIFDRLRIDDPVGALAVHLCCGIFGTVAVGLFASPALVVEGASFGLLYGGGVGLLGVQLLGCAAVVLFVGLASLGLFTAIRRTIGLRVEPEEEAIGLDRAEIGVVAYGEAVQGALIEPRREPPAPPAPVVAPRPSEA
ncbi:ammonium transporter [Vulgatibacter sp.]|uniref:ammonium transporter n=1 Tax=Vulgatibacter sp. TaxID=1971226 RepID=UPI003563F247